MKYSTGKRNEKFIGVKTAFFFLSKILQGKTIVGDWRVKSENFGLGALWVEIFHLKWKKFLKEIFKNRCFRRRFPQSKN